MKNAKLVRFLVLLLALCMMVSMFAACAAENEEDEAINGETDDGDTGTGDEVIDDNLDENGYLKDNIPEDFKLDREVKILFSQHMKNQICADETAAATGVVEEAIYKRWQNVQDRLDAEITWIGEDGQWNANRTIFMQKIKTQSEAGDAYDAVICYNLLPGAMAHQGLLQNLCDSDYIELDKPWWPQAYIEEALVNETVYGLVENSSKATLCNLHGTFFNNKLIENHGMTSPYDMVENNTWTFDNMMAMIKGIGYDLNSNGVKDNTDYFGLVTGTQAKIETWFFAMGYRYSQKTAEGGIELIMGDSDKMIEWIDRFNNALTGNDFLIYDSSHTKAFVEERAVLYMSSIQLVDSMIRNDVTMDYGVVPVPKGSEAQERYISNVANHHDSWCVPLNVKDFQESTGLIECMASESYRTVAPMYFETCVKLRYAPDERLYKMYDMIRDSITFDFCQTYSFVFNSNDPRTLITNCTKGTANWASQWANVGSTMENGFSDILTLYGLG